MPHPEILGRNGTYVVFRKLKTRVGAFRQYLRADARNQAEEQLFAAKFAGRMPDGERCREAVCVRSACTV